MFHYFCLCYHYYVLCTLNKHRKVTCQTPVNSSIMRPKIGQVFICMTHFMVFMICIWQTCEHRANDGKFKLRDLLHVPMQRVLKYHLLLRVSKYILDAWYIFMMTELSNTCLYNNPVFTAIPQLLLEIFWENPIFTFISLEKLFYWVTFGYQKKWYQTICVSSCFK